MHTVDVWFNNGVHVSPQFATQQEAVAHAGRMAQDSSVARSEVRGLAQDAEEHSLQVGLVGKGGARLSVSMRTSGPQSTSLENSVRRQVEAQTNANPEHKDNGPWKVASSSWVR